MLQAMEKKSLTTVHIKLRPQKKVILKMYTNKFLKHSGVQAYNHGAQCIKCQHSSARKTKNPLPGMQHGLDASVFETK